MNTQDAETVCEAIYILKYMVEQMNLQLSVGNPQYDDITVQFAKSIIASKKSKRWFDIFEPDDAADLRQTQEAALGVAVQ